MKLKKQTFCSYRPESVKVRAVGHSFSKSWWLFFSSCDRTRPSRQSQEGICSWSFTAHFCESQVFRILAKDVSLKIEKWLIENWRLMLIKKVKVFGFVYSVEENINSFLFCHLGRNVDVNISRVRSFKETHSHAIWIRKRQNGIRFLFGSHPWEWTVSAIPRCLDQQVSTYSRRFSIVDWFQCTIAHFRGLKRRFQVM